MKKVKTTLIVLVLLALPVLLGYSYFMADSVETRITDVQMTKVDGRFMIATEHSPMVNKDIWYRFKFDSGDVQNDAIRLKGKKVRIKKMGWRNTWFSAYENVISIKELNEKEVKQ